VIRAVLFDLDETLILDHPVSLHALQSCAFYAASRYSLDWDRLILDFSRHAKQLWEGSPTFEYTERIGHSYGEGLWARYAQTHPALARLQEWAPQYRASAWSAALAEQQIEDPALTEALVQRFIRERQLYPRYPEVDSLLKTLAPGYKIGIVTNGVPELQRDKLEGCGLMPYVEAVAVSGELDLGKPEPGIFQSVCAALGVEPAECVMVGDNPERDVAGAIRAGMKSVWVDRGFKPRDARFQADLELRNLLELLPWLEQQS